MPTWLPSAITLTLGVAAILSLYNGQHRIEQAHIQSKFADLEIIAMGVRYSNWPMEVLTAKIITTKDDLIDTKVPSLLEAVLAKGAN